MTDQLTLADYLGLARRRWMIIAAMPTLLASLALVWSLSQERVYTASAHVLINASSAAQDFSPGSQPSNTGTLTRALENEVRFLLSDQVQRLADDRLSAAGLAVVPGELERDNVRVGVSVSGEADELEIVAHATAATEAAIIASAYADSFISLRREAAVDDVLATARVVQERFTAVQIELEEVRSSDAARARVLESQLAAYGDALGNLSVGADLAGGGAKIVRQPKVPAGPVQPQTQRNIALGAVLGALLGAGLAFLAESLDLSVSDKKTVEAASGVSNLAVVPTVRSWRERDQTQIVTISDPQSTTAEAYRLLRSAIEFASVDQNIRTLQITSANAGEGKTTTAVNLAVTTARSGKRVALIDGDLRKPRIHVFFDLPVEPGLTNLILGQYDLDGVMQTVEDDAGALVAITSGPLPPGPSELIGSERTEAVLELIAFSVDLVLIDSPPVLPVADAVVLAKRVDATILVANGSRTSSHDLAEAVVRLRSVDANVIGTVLNEVRGGSHGYGYGYGYRNDV